MIRLRAAISGSMSATQISIAGSNQWNGRIVYSLTNEHLQDVDRELTLKLELELVYLNVTHIDNDLNCSSGAGQQNVLQGNQMERMHHPYSYTDYD